MQAEIDAFHKKIRARALLIAVEWAGSAGALGKMAGLSRYAGITWVRRGEIATICALSLSRIQGFPLSFEEMCPGEDKRLISARRCPHCDRSINPPDVRAASLPILIARSEASARKLAANTKPTKRKPRSAAPKP